MALFTAEPTWADRTLCISDTGLTLTYGDLDAFFLRFTAVARERSLGLLLCENIPGVLASYLAALRGWAVPILVDAHIHPTLLKRLLDAYQPAWVLVPNSVGEDSRRVLGDTQVLLDELDCQLLGRCGVDSPPLHPDLAVLLSISSPTGCPRMVRQTYGNLLINAHAIMEYLCLSEEERPITTLPMHTAYGMSVIQSHALVGSPILMTTHSIQDPAFWDFFKAQKATSLAGPPHIYAQLDQLGLYDMELPSLRCLTQSEGPLPHPLQQKLALWARDTGRRFYVMHDRCEATARMGFLPWQYALDKPGSMGIAIPGGAFLLVNEKDEPVLEPGQVGELRYRGTNVALGYADCAADLSLPDQFLGRFHTGDLARRDEEGFYYLAGRKSRDVQLLGQRTSLDDVQLLLSQHFPQAGFACTGQNDLLELYTDSAEPDLPRLAVDYLSQLTGLPRSLFRAAALPSIPRDGMGTPLYDQLSWPE